MTGSFKNTIYGNIHGVHSITHCPPLLTHLSLSLPKGKPYSCSPLSMPPAQTLLDVLTGHLLASRHWIDVFWSELHISPLTYPHANQWANNEPPVSIASGPPAPVNHPVGFSSRQLSGLDTGEKTIVEVNWEVIYPNSLPNAGFSDNSVTSSHLASLCLYPVTPRQPVLMLNKLHSCHEPNPVTTPLTDLILASAPMQSRPHPSLQATPCIYLLSLFYMYIKASIGFSLSV